VKPKEAMDPSPQDGLEELNKNKDKNKKNNNNNNNNKNIYQMCHLAT
jgi:hypothetical protein